MSEQIDIAVDLGVVPAPLPEIEFLRAFVGKLVQPPPEIVDGVLHQGCKLVLSGSSKSNKSWCLLDLAMSVASGQDWWGRRCIKTPVVYINFELHRWAIAQRLKATLVAFGCDPKVFTYSQPVRVPGAFRDGRLQRLIWLRN